MAALAGLAVGATLVTLGRLSDPGAPRHSYRRAGATRAQPPSSCSCSHRTCTKRSRSVEGCVPLCTSCTRASFGLLRPSRTAAAARAVGTARVPPRRRRQRRHTPPWRPRAWLRPSRSCACCCPSSLRTTAQVTRYSLSFDCSQHSCERPRRPAGWIWLWRAEPNPQPNRMGSRAWPQPRLSRRPTMRSPP